MTLPSSSGSSHKRAEKACIRCRAAKVRCPSTINGSDERRQGEPCSRCTRLKIQCDYAPSKRLGRPRRKDKEQIAIRTSQLTNPWREQEASLPSYSGSLVASDSTSTNSGSNASFANQTNASVVNQTSSSVNQTNPSVNQTNPGFESTEAVDATPMDFSLDTYFSPLPLFVTPDGKTGSSPYYIAIFNEYRYNVHHCIPVLPSEEIHLEFTIRTAPPLLMTAILSIAYPTSREAFDLPAIDPVLPDLQAAVLFILIYFGRGDFEKAQAILNQASNCLVSLRPSFLEWETSGGSVFSSEDDNKLSQWRRVWWECWTWEILLSTVVGTGTIVLGNETFRPSLPCANEVSTESLSELDCETLYIQAIGLMHQAIKMKAQQISLEQLTQFSNIGFNIFTHSRQKWVSAISANSVVLPSSDSGLKRVVNCTRSLYTALIAVGSVIALHLSNLAPMTTDSENWIDPPPGSVQYLSTICQAVFKLVRDSMNFYTSVEFMNSKTGKRSDSSYRPPAPQHPPFFSCVQRVAAIGSFIALTRSPSLQTQEAGAEVARAALVTDFQLAETSIARQCSRWSSSEFMANEIKILRRKMQGHITGNNTRVLIGAL